MTKKNNDTEYFVWSIEKKKFQQRISDCSYNDRKKGVLEQISKSILCTTTEMHFFFQLFNLKVSFF